MRATLTLNLGDAHTFTSISDVAGDALVNEQFPKRLKYILAFQLSGHLDRQALPGKLIDDVEYPKRPPIMGAAMHEVITPYMIPG